MAVNDNDFNSNITCEKKRCCPTKNIGGYLVKQTSFRNVGGYLVESCYPTIRIEAYDNLTDTMKFKDNNFVGQILYLEQNEASYNYFEDDLVYCYRAIKNNQEFTLDNLDDYFTLTNYKTHLLYIKNNNKIFKVGNVYKFQNHPLKKTTMYYAGFFLIKTTIILGKKKYLKQHLF